jgi:hypothetical protein
MAKVFVVGDAKTVLVIPETVSVGERTEAFMYGIAVEWVGHVSSVDCVEVFGDGNVGSEGDDERGVRVIWTTRKWIGEICFPRPYERGPLLRVCSIPLKGTLKSLVLTLKVCCTFLRYL